VQSYFIARDHLPCGLYGVLNSFKSSVDNASLFRLPILKIPMKFPALMLAFVVGLTLVASAAPQHFLYVAEPGIRNYVQHGGHGVLVYDIDHDYHFVKRIPTGSIDEKGVPVNVKGICANAATGLLYVSTIRHLMCIDLHTDKLLWTKTDPRGFDRMSISNDGGIIYQPTFEKDEWYLIDGASGDTLKTIGPNPGAHNTVISRDGKTVYLAGLKSNGLAVCDTGSQTITRKLGPFSGSVRPFTIDGSNSYLYANVNGLLGFEIADLKTGKVVKQIKVTGVPDGQPLRHGCPSHGIALTPDETELWITDGFNGLVHVFDMTTSEPLKKTTIKVGECPGWITFSLDGKTAWPSSGEVIDIATKRTLTTLKDEQGQPVMSEKMVEVVFDGDDVIATGDQFARGARATPLVTYP
jgi:DNA-binding beta-propeller fold protein YncE